MSKAEFGWESEPEFEGLNKRQAVLAGLKLPKLTYKFASSEETDTLTFKFSETESETIGLDEELKFKIGSLVDELKHGGEIEIPAEGIQFRFSFTGTKQGLPVRQVTVIVPGESEEMTSGEFAVSEISDFFYFADNNRIWCLEANQSIDGTKMEMLYPLLNNRLIELDPEQRLARSRIWIEYDREGCTGPVLCTKLQIAENFTEVHEYQYLKEEDKKHWELMSRTSQGQISNNDEYGDYQVWLDMMSQRLCRKSLIYDRKTDALWYYLDLYDLGEVEWEDLFEQNQLDSCRYEMGLPEDARWQKMLQLVIKLNKDGEIEQAIMADDVGPMMNACELDEDEGEGVGSKLGIFGDRLLIARFVAATKKGADCLVVGLDDEYNVVNYGYGMEKKIFPQIIRPSVQKKNLYPIIVYPN
jgi:hypothetical protein